MAVYTVLTKSDVDEIMSYYGISNILSFKELEGGSQNSNYVVRNFDKAFVISICEQNSDEEAINLVSVLEYLRTAKFDNSIVVRTLYKMPISRWKEKPLILKEFLEGKVLDDIPEEMIIRVGQQLGKLHKVAPLKSLPNTPSYGKAFFHEVGHYSPNSEFHKWLQKKMSYIEMYLTKDLPKSMIHSDVFSSNVIIDEARKRITIMDFEEASHYYRVYDVAMTFIGVCREEKGINYDKAIALIKGYQKEIVITEEEKRGLQAFVVYAASSMSFWRHRNFHFTVPTPSMFDHYIELKDIADTVQNENAEEFYTTFFDT